MSARRTQAERKAATVGRLVQATAQALADLGYAGATISEICARAQVSSGALFRHFPSRLALIAHTTEALGEGQLAFVEGLASPLPDTADPIETWVRFAREASRSDTHAAWREVMIAARTDVELRTQVSPVLKAYEGALHSMALRLLAPNTADPLRAQMVALSALHLFDSEATTRAVYCNPEIEAARLDWVCGMLRRELEG
jgi:AcrR family transcriptional regulator